jgi:DNA-binding NarL/FixJ family response regulator
MTIRVYLADDHVVMRDGLRALLEDHPEITVVGDGGSGPRIVSDIQSLHPDIVLMDILMPDFNGIDATELILEVAPNTRVIILSMLGTCEYVFSALKAGARGYLLKESAGREVIDAIFCVYEGKIYLSQPVTSTLITDYVNLHQSADHRTPLEELSEREREVLRLVVDGWTSVEIGNHLHLSPKTVESYRSRMMKKLGVSDIPGLMKFAIRVGMVP